MIHCTCFVQEGQLPDQKQTTLKTVLDDFTNSSFGQSAEIAWIPVPAGNGFTAGQPSTSSVVSITAPDAIASNHRESLLRELVALWTSETGCSVDEIVAVLADPDADPAQN